MWNTSRGMYPATKPMLNTGELSQSSLAVWVSIPEVLTRIGTEGGLGELSFRFSLFLLESSLKTSSLTF